MISFQFTGLKCMLQLITVYRWSQVLSNVNALCTVDWLSSIELNGEVTWARIVKSLSTGFILKSLALSTSHPCGFAPILPFSMCSSLLTSNVFLGAAEVIFGEIFTCFFAWYKKSGCDNADNDDQNVDKQDDDQIWSDGRFWCDIQLIRGKLID